MLFTIKNPQIWSNHQKNTEQIHRIQSSTWSNFLDSSWISNVFASSCRSASRAPADTLRYWAPAHPHRCGWLFASWHPKRPAESSGSFPGRHPKNPKEHATQWEHHIFLDLLGGKEVIIKYIVWLRASALFFWWKKSLKRLTLTITAHSPPGLSKKKRWRAVLWWLAVPMFNAWLTKWNPKVVVGSRGHINLNHKTNTVDGTFVP